MNPLSQSHTTRSGSGCSRGRRFGAALTGAALLFASAGVSVALAGGGAPPKGSSKAVANQSAIAFGYGNQITQVATQVFTPPARLVAPKPKPQPQVFTPPPPVQHQTLPFTGAQLSVFVGIGLLLLVGGATLRSTGRRELDFAGQQPVAWTPEPASSDPLEVRRRLAREAARLGGLIGPRHDES